MDALLLSDIRRELAELFKQVKQFSGKLLALQTIVERHGRENDGAVDSGGA